MIFHSIGICCKIRNWFSFYQSVIPWLVILQREGHGTYPEVFTTIGFPWSNIHEWPKLAIRLGSCSFRWVLIPCNLGKKNSIHSSVILISLWVFKHNLSQCFGCFYDWLDSTLLSIRGQIMFFLPSTAPASLFFFVAELVMISNY